MKNVPEGGTQQDCFTYVAKMIKIFSPFSG